MKIKFTQTETSPCSGLGAEIERSANEMTIKELCLMRYRCAALTGALAFPGDDDEDYPSWHSVSHEALADYVNDIAQTMLALDDETETKGEQ